MSTGVGIRVSQKERLYSLLLIKKVNDQSGNKVLELNREISRAETGMEKEDIAFVREQIANLEI